MDFFMKDNTIPAVEKALKLLEMLGHSAYPLSKQEMESALEIAPTTCYRILCTLKKNGWVRKTGTNTWTAGSALPNAARNMLERENRFARLQPEIDQLSRETGLSSKLSIRREDRQCTFLRGESSRAVQVNSKAGAEFPLIEGSVGAALLAGETPESIRQLVRECRESIPEKEDPGLLPERIRRLRKDGFCLNLHSRWNVNALSMPVRDADGRIAAALTLLGWEDDFSKDRLPGLLRTLKKISELCSKKIQ